MKRKFYLRVSLVLALFCTTAGIVNAQLNQRAMDQMKKLLDEKSQRTPTERKVTSQLLQAIREKNGTKMTDGVDLEPSNVDADADGYLLVDIRAKVSDELLQAITKAGGVIISSYAQYDAIRARINLNKVLTIAALPAVINVMPAAKAMTVGAGNRSVLQMGTNGTDNKNLVPAAPATKTLPARRQRLSLKERQQKIKEQLEKYLQEQERNAVLQAGTVNSQGDRAHRADDVRSTYGVQGQSIRIGVLSDSYNASGAAQSDIYTGNLPGTGNPLGYTLPVTVVQDFAGSSDEGRAMIQIVHDLAPKAQLYFATAFVSEAGFASNIVALRNTYNCDIIIDDIFYYDEPQFQDGIVAQAVSTVTAAGALYFSSAGNENSVRKNTAGIWEGDFNDAGSAAFTGTATPGTIHNWGTVSTPINGDIVTTAGQRYTLIWSDSYYASGNDYDLFLISSTGAVKAMSTSIQDGNDLAFEQIVPPAAGLAPGDRLVVFKKTGAAVRAFALNTFRGRLTNFTTGQTHGHSAIPAAYSVAAASALQTSGTPFSTGNVVETFTSDGLRRMFTNPDGSAITPGNVLFAGGGTTRNKPDITAADGVSTTLQLNGGLNPFFGTSAAAPHAGAIAALIKNALPSITPAQMRTALTTTTLDIELPGYDNVAGFGIVQAFQATQSVGPTLRADVSLNSFTPVEGIQNNGSGAPDPGEAIQLFVSLKNASAVTAGAVSGTLTTTTPNINISTPVSTFGNMVPGANSANTVAPFTFVIGSSVPCGTEINFTLTVSYTGGTSPQSFPLVVRVGDRPLFTFSAILGTPAASTSIFTSSTGTQTGRLFRDGVASVCGTAKPAPTLTATTGARTYDAYRFTNTTLIQQCVTVTYSIPNGLLLYMAAYNNSGFVPATPNTNFLAEFGLSGAGGSFSFNVPGGQSYTIVVHEVNVAGGVSTPYTLFVSTNTCSSVILPVTWLGFTATEKGGQAALQWKVANEINADRYEVEHSTDGSRFTKLYTVPATTAFTSEKTYSQVHPFPVAGTNYYRIRQMDKDGHFAYTKIELVRISKANSIVIAPNPASSFVTVQAKSVIRRINMYSAAGQLVLSTAPSAATSTLLVNQLPAGQYSLVIETRDETIRKKIIKK